MFKIMLPNEKRIVEDKMEMNEAILVLFKR